MRKRIFGFDLGTASVGWAVVDFSDEFYNPESGEAATGKIVKSGVRIFPVAENPKDGSSLAQPRREKRQARRICRRKARRMSGIKKMFVAKGLVGGLDQLEEIYAGQDGGDVWDLRIKALTEPLTKNELLRVLTHLAKHRGFKSYRKAAEEKDAEGGKILKAINENKSLLTGDKTLAQVITERAGPNGRKRNYAVKDSKNNKIPVYNNSIPRTEIERELDLIYGRQKEYGLFSEDLYADFKKIAFRFRPISGVSDKIGLCQFEANEKRAPKEAPSSELFVAWSKINNLAVYEDDKKRFLSQEERHKLMELLKITQKVKYNTIAKKVLSGKDIRFSDINYAETVKKNRDGTVKAINPEDVLFYEMKGWHKLKNNLSQDCWKMLCEDICLADRVVNVIACEKNDESIAAGLQTLGINEKYIEELKALTFDKFINLSLKAVYKLIPFMQEGLKYNEACDKAGYDFRTSGNKLIRPEDKGILLPVLPAEKLTKVPVVNRTVAQFRKVYNALVRQYGCPDQVNIETGRELKKSFDERRKIKAKIGENEAERAAARVDLAENNIKGSSTNILKYRLYQEQDCKCVYSGKAIDLRRLDEEGYAEIDHILPYSRSLDNSYNNKVLCLSEENQLKSSKTPFEYIAEDKWGEFKVRVRAMKAMGARKKENLLTEHFDGREQEFRERNANDNNYIARFVKQYVEEGIDFSASGCTGIVNRVQMRTGALTDYLRHCWGLKKDRSESDKHHAQDAIVIACATPGMVKFLSTIAALRENKWELAKFHGKGEAWYKALKHKFSEPWSGFRDEVQVSLEEIFVSRPLRKSASGEVHQETLYSLNPNHKNYDEKNLKSGIKIRGGLASNGSMLRTDVFVRKNKAGKDEFYLVPVYLSAMGKDLPDKAIVPAKDEKDWQVIDDSFTFKFSLYMDDLVKVTKGDKEIFGYFKGTDRSCGSIKIEAHDRSFSASGIGVKTQHKFQKYAVDPLGRIVEVRKEVRLPLTRVKPKSRRRKEQQEKKPGRE